MAKSNIKTIDQAVREKIDDELFDKWVCGEEELTHKEWSKINSACCFAYNDLANKLDEIEEIIIKG